MSGSGGGAGRGVHPPSAERGGTSARNSADDRIYHVPPGAAGTVLLATFPFVVHKCPQATVVRARRRDELDPMALGECRLCGQALPDTT